MAEADEIVEKLRKTNKKKNKKTKKIIKKLNLGETETIASFLNDMLEINYKYGNLQAAEELRDLLVQMVLYQEKLLEKE